MHLVYWLSVYLHILSAIVWIGGIAFLVLVVVPWLRRDGQSQAASFLAQTGRRFRTIGWWCFGVLSVTGTFNLWFRGVRLSSFGDPAWRASDFGRAVEFKLTVFALVLIISVVHDYWIGPRATESIRRAPTSPETAKLRRLASRLGRLNALLALLLLAAAVAIVRGLP